MAGQIIAAAMVFLGTTSAQQIGHSVPEVHPKLPTQKCTVRGGCVKQDTSVVIDQLYRPVHAIDDPSATCGNWSIGLNTTLCPDEASCAKNCVLDGVDYASWGVETQGDALTLNQFVKNPDGSLTSAGPRVYLLAEGKNYEKLQLLNMELSFDVDVSKLVCGMNGAIYLSEMSSTGARSALNPAGAQYGTGYCDAQCPVLPWINGVANINNTHGACCNEMDLWEANALSTAYTPHACNISEVYECTGDACGSTGVCDKSGCGFNPYALGDHSYYGRGLEVDTDRKLSVVTQFVTNDGTPRGYLKEIRRLYVQDGKVVKNAVVQISGLGSVSSITDAYCEETASKFQQQGALKGMGEALQRGMVLVFSVWDDTGGYMNWLDSGSAGPCNSTEGNPVIIQAEHPDAAVVISNVKWGEIGSTYSGISCK